MIRELEGGAIDNVRDAPQKSKPKVVYETDTHRVVQHRDTPNRRAYHRLVQDWTPMMAGHEPPPFAKIVEDLEFDESTFGEEPRYHYLPDKEPTGRGHLADDRETSHWVGEVLDKIHPDLGRVYRGGAVNSHLEDAELFRHNVVYSRPRRKFTGH